MEESNENTGQEAEFEGTGGGDFAQTESGWVNIDIPSGGQDGEAGGSGSAQEANSEANIGSDDSGGEEGVSDASGSDAGSNLAGARSDDLEGTETKGENESESQDSGSELAGSAGDDSGGGQGEPEQAEQEETLYEGVSPETFEEYMIAIDSKLEVANAVSFVLCIAVFAVLGSLVLQTLFRKMEQF